MSSSSPFVKMWVSSRVNRFFFFLSWAIVLYLIVNAICNMLNCAFSPAWLVTYVVPIATAAAVGYLTNYIAIWLLFNPYEPFWGIQGVIPREKKQLAISLGRMIPEKLLPPEKLTVRVGTVIQTYLRRPEFAQRVREGLVSYVSQNRDTIATLLLPQIRIAILNALNTYLTREKIQNYYDESVIVWLADADNRFWISQKAVKEIEHCLPKVMPELQTFTAEAVENYIRENYPMLAMAMDPKKVGRWCIEKINWSQVQSSIQDKLRSPEISQSIGEEVMAISERFRDVFSAPEHQSQIAQFIEKLSDQLDHYITHYLNENISKVLDTFIINASFWTHVETHFLPALESFILQHLEKDSHAILESLDLQGGIESSVNDMDMKQVHEMITDVTNEHLIAIQLLGFLLGAIAGALLLTL